MRRVLVATALVALTFTAAASAKELSVSLASEPPSLLPGEVWNATLLVHGDKYVLPEARPSVEIHGAGGMTATFVARKLPTKAADGQLQYRAEVVFPTAGTWRYAIVDGVTDRAYEDDVVKVGTPVAAPTSASARPDPVATSDGFPLWPLAAVGIALLAAALVAVRRRHSTV